MSRYAYHDADGNVTRTITGPVDEAEAGIHEGEAGWTVLEDDGTDTTTTTIEQLRAAKLNRLAALRWASESAGVSVDGVVQPTSRDSRASMLAIITSLNATATIEWKALSGWQTLTVTDLKTIAAAVETYVQACFCAEKTVTAQISALVDDDVSAFDVSAAWATALAATTTREE